MRPLLYSLLLVLALLTLTPAEAANERTIRIKVPRLTLPPGADVETCYFARIPASAAFQLGSFRIAHKGTSRRSGVRHFLVYLYTGERIGEFPVGAGVQSRGCLDLGPIDRDRRVLVASGGSNKRIARTLPKGVAAELAPVSAAPGGAPAAIGLLVDTNWGNEESRSRTVSTKLVLKAAKKATRTARPLSDRSAEAGIFVPPFAEAATASGVDARWTAATPSCVLGLSTQMHRRGVCAGVDLLGIDGQPKNPSGSPENPCDPGRRQLFVGLDFTDPGSLAFSVPLAVGAGEALGYGCWLNNGAGSFPVRLGCEAVPGVVPGAVGSPATPCVQDADCAGGAACVPANAVAGSDVDDEVCGITAFVYDAEADGRCAGAP